MPSTYSTGYPPHSVYRTPLTTAEQTMVWSSGAHAEFQDGSDARYRSGSRQIMRSGSSMQFESGSKADFKNGSMVEVSSGATLKLQGNIRWPNIIRLSSNSTRILKNGITIIDTTEDGVWTFTTTPVAGDWAKVIITGNDSSKCHIKILASTNQTVKFNRSTANSLTVTTAFGVAVQSKWLEFIGDSTRSWTLASHGPAGSSVVERITYSSATAYTK